MSEKETLKKMNGRQVRVSALCQKLSDALSGVFAPCMSKEAVERMLAAGTQQLKFNTAGTYSSVFDPSIHPHDGRPQSRDVIGSKDAELEVQGKVVCHRTVECDSPAAAERSILAMTNSEPSPYALQTAIKTVRACNKALRFRGRSVKRLLADPRADKDVCALVDRALGWLPDPLPPRRLKGWDKKARELRRMEFLYTGVLETLPRSYQAVEQGVSVSALTIGTGVDVVLMVPQTVDPKTAPLVYYIHGGGMAVLRTHTVFHRCWASLLANAGMCVAAVDFVGSCRHPFPAGLTDCVTGLEGVLEHMTQQYGGHGKVVLHGESGGGNLSLATAMLAKRQQKQLVDGLFCCCPFISGSYTQPPPAELPSLSELDGYFLQLSHLQLTAEAYTKDGSNDKDSDSCLAWPLKATEDDLKGLPPIVIWVNELDPLRSEGEMFHAKASKAGVDCTLREAGGTMHSAEVVLATIAPDTPKVMELVLQLKKFTQDISESEPPVGSPDRPEPLPATQAGGTPDSDPPPSHGIPDGEHHGEPLPPTHVIPDGEQLPPTSAVTLTQ